jgi:hypothetical protein
MFYLSPFLPFLLLSPFVKPAQAWNTTSLLPSLPLSPIPSSSTDVRLYKPAISLVP